MSLNSTQKTAITTAVTNLQNDIAALQAAVVPSGADKQDIIELVAALNSIMPLVVKAGNTHVAKG